MRQTFKISTFLALFLLPMVSFATIGDGIPENLFSSAILTTTNSLFAKRIESVSYKRLTTPTFQIQGGFGMAFGSNLGQAPSVLIRYNPIYMQSRIGLNSTIEVEYKYFVSNNIQSLTGRVGINVAALAEGNLSRRLFNTKQSGEIPKILIDPEFYVAFLATKFSNQAKILVGGSWFFQLNLYFKSKDRSKNELAPVSAFIGFGMDIYANGNIRGVNYNPETEWRDVKQFVVTQARVGISANFGGNRKSQTMPSWDGK